MFVIELTSFNFNIKYDFFAFLKRFHVKFINYNLYLFITKRVDFDNVFLNNREIK